MVVAWIYLYDLLSELFGRLFGWVTEVGEATNIEFRQLLGAEVYVPLIRSRLFPDPFLAAEVSSIPKAFLPVHENMTLSREEIDTHCLVSQADLPFLPTPEARAKLFG